MKKLYLLRATLWIALSFCAIYQSKAQSLPPGAEVDETFYNRMNYIFGPLEKNRVPYGLLRDYTMEFTNLENYNGTALTDSNLIDQAAFWEIYQTLFTARVHTNAGTWKNPTLFDSLWYAKRYPGRLALAGLCVGYGKFKSYAATSNLVTISNDQIYDRYDNGTWVNSYFTDVALAITLAIESYKGRRFEVILAQSIWKTNQNIRSIQFNPSDGGGFRTLTLNQAFGVAYADTGVKVWNFKVTLTSGKITLSHSQIHIDYAVDPADDQPPPAFTTLALPAGPQSITATESYEGKKAEGYITIEYANPADPQLRRPLIVAEGYDPGHITKPEEKYGVIDIDEFRRNVNQGNPSVLKQILIDNPQYDIVYVDWKKGTDDIFRNAKLLKDVVRMVNNNKVLVNGAKQPNVIIGQSMGGLVTRIALKEMENAGESTDTRLFISQDSPHQGANVPVAFQYLVRHTRNIYFKTGPIAALTEIVQFIRGGVSPLQALNITNQPASRQMLVTYINDYGNPDNSVHNTFQQQLTSIGYPQQTRNVAISNGSECAEGQGFQPGASLISYVGKTNTRFLADLAINGLSYLITVMFPNPITRWGIIPGRNEFKAELQLNSVVNGGGNRVYYSDVRFTKKVLYLINVNVVLAHKEQNSPTGILSYDSYAGGYFALPSFKSSYDENWFFKNSVTASNQPAFNFVPMASSLDVGGGSVTLADGDFKAVYSSASPPASPK